MAEPECGRNVSKAFNRAVRALMLAYEALSVSWLDAFFSWCVENDLMKSFPERFWSCSSKVASNFQSVTEMKTSIDVAMDAIESYMLPLMEDFRQYGCNASSTFKFWDMFRNVIEIMLQNIRSEREGIWKLHLSSVSAMLPLIFVTNRVITIPDGCLLTFWTCLTYLLR